MDLLDFELLLSVAPHVLQLRKTMGQAKLKES